MSSDSPFDDFTPATHVTLESVELTTDDGITISADIETPASTRAVAALLHPHPLFGGRRDHPLLLSIAHALHRNSVTTARSDFRHASGNTIEEMPDAIACCHELQRRHRKLPLVIVGYSFGSIVAARIASVVGAQHLIMIAPPLSTVSLEIPATSTTLIIAEHDQFSPPATISDDPIVKEAGMSIVAGADHFLNGHISTVTELTVVAATTALGE